jgi:DGQHR domain-containing protein
VPRYNPATKKGYQRDPDESRAVKAAEHLLKGGTFPGATILSLREEDMDEVREKVLEDYGHYQLVEVHIPEGITLWLVDGQHRHRGLVIAKQRKPTFNSEAFGLAAVIMISPSEMDEALVFRTVHETQKRVSTDLVNRILQREVEEGRAAPETLISSGQKGNYRKYVAVKVTDALATQEDSPWVDLIRPVNPGQLPTPEEGGPEGDWPISETGMEASLKEFIKHMGIASPEKTLGIVKTYWRAVVRRCSEAWNDPENYPHLQKSAGIYILNGLLPTAYDLARENGGVTEEAFVEILSNAGIDSGYFEEDGPLDGIGGVGGFKKMIEEMEARLYSVYSTS